MSQQLTSIVIIEAGQVRIAAGEGAQQENELSDDFKEGLRNLVRPIKRLNT